MTIWRMMQANPLAALTLLCCLLTLYKSARLVGHMKWWDDRYLIAFIGLISIEQGLRVLKNEGVIGLGSRPLESAVDLIVAALFLLALMVARTQASDHHQARMTVRLLEANLRNRTPNPAAEDPAGLPSDKLARVRRRAARRLAQAPDSAGANVGA
ncbi:MAG: hypothetical protein HY858_01110 [Candidatus Solibacter usitatus]|nr:hypothetical protein [Candidatus Solibacter usitatus]